MLLWIHVLINYTLLQLQLDLTYRYCYNVFVGWEKGSLCQHTNHLFILLELQMSNIKLVKEAVMTSYGSKEIKWWLPEGTKYLPKIYLIKGAYEWHVYDENDNRIVENFHAGLRTKKDAIAWVEAFDGEKDEQITREKEEEEARDAKHAETRRIEKEYNESFKKDVDVNFDSKVGDTINIKMFTLSKLNSMGDGLTFNMDYGRALAVSKGKIEEIKVVSNKEYDEFVCDFFDCSLSDSFSGGGTTIDDSRIEEYNSYMDLPQELREFYNRNCYDLVTIVMSDNRQPIVVNPYGYSYVRYAGVVA